MSQRFPSAGPAPGVSPGPGGAPPASGQPQPPQRYPPPPQQPAQPRQYSGSPFPPPPQQVAPQQRTGFTPPPGPPSGGGAPARGGSSGGGYSPIRPPGPAPQTPKRPADNRSPMPPHQKPYVYNNLDGCQGGVTKKKKRLADKILVQKVRDLVPESQAYMDLLAFERKLDATILRKRLDIQEALKRPMKQKRKLRIFISNTFYPGGGEGGSVASWELRVEGRLLEDGRGEAAPPPAAPPAGPPNAPAQPKPVKRKFSSFFKSLVIELDKELYGPDNHLVEWHRTVTTQETDGFQVKRPGYKNVRCTILLLLDYQPLQFKLDGRLARLLGVHTQTRPVIIAALWQYIKTHKLQEPHEREYIACDKYLEQIFNCSRIKFAEIPARLSPLLHPPDPIVINHVIGVEAGGDTKQTACYDIDVEVEDSLKTQMNSFLASTGNHHDIQQLDHKIYETVDTINQLKTNREFFLSFAHQPQRFIQKWLVSQSRDLKCMREGYVGGAGAGAGAGAGGEEERRAAAWAEGAGAGGWTGEAVHRYLHAKAHARQGELESQLHRAAALLQPATPQPPPPQPT